jgi:hypothetical protein
MTNQAFARFWNNDLTRSCLLSFLQPEDLKCLRLVQSNVAAEVAPVLFRALNVRFTATSFTRHARLAALDRIGPHIKTFRFIVEHKADTFLPPLIAADALKEVKFVYEPQTVNSRPSSSSSSASGSKYGSWKLSDLLIKHYPPLFHAATNVPAFINVIAAMPNVCELSISCPGQINGPTNHRSIVDYALISLRMAVEQVNLRALETLTLDHLHSGAILYLRPQNSYGSNPASTRVWRRIRKLNITMQSPTSGTEPSTDHVKILHTYLQNFTALNHFNFRWTDGKGPCPVSLHAEPCASRPVSRDCTKACPTSCTVPPYKPLRFRELRTMRLENASMDASQAASFIMMHRKVLHEFQFDECHLRSGTWDDALAPLSRITGNKNWRQPRQPEEVMDVPLVFVQQEVRPSGECVRSQLWDDQIIKTRGLEALRKVSMRTKGILPGHIKRSWRLLRSASFAWF